MSLIPLLRTYAATLNRRLANLRERRHSWTNKVPNRAVTSASFGRLAIAALGVCVASHAEVIPESRLTNWKPGVTVGVPNGIPTNRANLVDVTKAPYNADRTGATDTRAAIQAAIDAAKPLDVVYLPAGTYRIDGSLLIGSQKSDITLRGAGSATIIDCRTSNYGIAVGTYHFFNWPEGGASLQPADLAKGANILKLQDTSAFSVGQLVYLNLANDPQIPVVSVVGYDLRPQEAQWQGLRRQITRITAKSANTLTFSPGLYGDYTGAPHARLFTSQQHTSGIGIEDLTIDCVNGATSFPVGFNTSYGCWAKNVRVQNSSNYGIYISESLDCEIRQCWIDKAKGQGGTNHTGLMMDTAVGCLIEDNVIVHNFPSIMVNQGSAGNVVAYNFCYDSTSYGASGCAINTNHGPHNSFNLYEGNIAPNVQSDGYFGGSSHDVIYRNWLHGMQPGITTPGWTVSLNRFTRAYSLVGNILGSDSIPTEGVSLGNPNMGNSAYTGEGPPWSVTWVNGPGTLSQSGDVVSSTAEAFLPSHVGWYLMTPSKSTFSRIEKYISPQSVAVGNSQTLTSVSYIIAPGPIGYQELDLGVAATLLRKANYNYRDRTIPAGESIGEASLPNSLYLPAAPAWFGSLPWPAFDPRSPNPSFESIPAGYRYVHGSVPGGTPPPPPQTTQPPSNVRIQITTQ